MRTQPYVVTPHASYDAKALLKKTERMMRNAISAGDSTGLVSASRSVEAAQYHLDTGGQRVRAQLALQSGLALDLEIHNVTIIAATVELLHNASLIHDDLQDRSAQRRGADAVWAAYGVDIAICTGDLMISAAYAALGQLSTPIELATIFRLVHGQVATAISGQCADLACQKGEQISIAHYEQIAMAKSGALLSLPCELSLHLCDAGQHAATARHAAYALSVAYQIHDDIEDIADDYGCAQARNSLNVLTVLRDAGVEAHEVLSAAKSRGQQHVELAIQSAQRMPHRSGLALDALARRLKLQLQSVQT